MRIWEFGSETGREIGQGKLSLIDIPSPLRWGSRETGPAILILLLCELTRPLLTQFAHICPFQSGSEWLAVATHGFSSAPYACNGRSYGIRRPTTGPAGDTVSASSPPLPPPPLLSGVFFWKVPTIFALSAKREGQTRTPISHDAIRTSPAPFTASPHACLDRFAEVLRAQSMDESAP